MTNEQIERLAMDLACGEMNEDVGALFETYLAEHAEVRQTADGFAAVCRRCEEGLDVGQEMAASRPKKPFVKRERMLAYGRAAILVLGVLLGMQLGRLSRPAAPETVQVAASGAERVTLQTPLEDGFWKEKAEALMKPKLLAVDTKTQTNETFWGRYRKELSYVKTDME